MKKIYEKSQLYFALIWSGVYVVLMSAADSVSETIGTAKIVTAPVCIGLVLAMYLWIRRNGQSSTCFSSPLCCWRPPIFGGAFG